MLFMAQATSRAFVASVDSSKLRRAQILLYLDLHDKDYLSEVNMLPGAAYSESTTSESS